MTQRYVVAVQLVRAPPVGRHPNPATVVDLFWAHAAPADRLDHVRVPPPGVTARLDVVVILRAESAADAVRTTEALCARAAQGPALSGWTPDWLSTVPMSRLDR